MAKKQQKKVKSSKKPEKKEAITIKVPDVKKNPLVLVVAVLAVLLVVSVIFNLKPKAPVTPTDGPETPDMMYICPTGQCDTESVGTWFEELEMSSTSFEADWALGPIGLYMTEGKVSIVDVSNENNFYRSMCNDGGLDEACGMFDVCTGVDKTNKPELEAFVVSYCPFGTQMQRVLAEVQKAIGDDADIKVRYIGAVVDGKVTAMHGEQEAEENHRQICLREEQPDKFWDYVSCFIKAGNTESCLEETEIDTAMLDECMADPERGVKYAQVDFTNQNTYGVTGSPTLILGGKRVSESNFGGRSAESLKKMLCCGMEDEAKGCEQELKTAQAAVGFSEKYSEGDDSGGSAASCG